MTTLEHDVDYFNMKKPTVDNALNADKKAIINSMKTTDPYYGNIATVVGLALKNVVESTVQFANESPIYPRPNENQYHIPWFDTRNTKKKELRKYAFSLSRPSATFKTKLELVK